MTRRCFSSAALTVSVCFGEESGALEGRITDETGQPVAAALLKAQHTVRQNTHTSTSGADGRYRWDALPGGIYNLYVSRRGYCSVWLRQVVVRPGQTTKRDVTLLLDTACAPSKRGN
jgi:Carboxypeptidase regulatory-like domain